MVGSIDPRIIRVGIEVSGKLRMYEGLWCNIRVSKYANPLQNEAQIQIANLSKDVRDYIQTETSPYNRKRSFKRCIIEAGRESFGASRIYKGDIIESRISQPPDIVLSLKCKTAWGLKGSMVALGLPSVASLSEAASATAKNMGLSLQFEADDKSVSNYSYTGAKAGQINTLSDAGGVDCFVDDDKLVVKNKGASLKDSSHVLSEDTGMIGVPELTDQGVRVKFLFTPRVQLGASIEIKSKLNPSLSGRYVIYRLDYDLSSRDTPFYITADCRRPGAFRYGLI